MNFGSVAKLVYRTIPSGTLFYAAVGKLVALHGTPDSYGRAFTRRGTAIRKVTLPICESFIAAAMLFPASSRLARLISTTFFIVGSFQSAIVIVKRDTQRCNCFGSFSKMTIGRLTLIRNIALALITISPNFNLPKTISRAKAPKVANRVILTANLGFLVILIILVIRNGIVEALNRTGPGILRLTVGQSIPHVYVYDTCEVKVDLAELWQSVEGLSYILFLSGQCISCRELHERILGSNWLTERFLTIWIGTNRTEQDSRSRSDLLTNSVRTFYDTHSAASAAFGIRSAPTCIVLDRDGRIIDNYHIGKDAVASLVTHMIATTPTQ